MTYRTHLTPDSPATDARQRGAALITVLLLATIVLLAGGSLALTSTKQASNSVDAAAETESYYAAETGLQAALEVLRGNRKPTPLFVPLVSDALNEINFTKASDPLFSNVVSEADLPPRLSRWRKPIPRR